MKKIIAAWRATATIPEMTETRAYPTGRTMTLPDGSEKPLMAFSQNRTFARPRPFKDRVRLLLGNKAPT